jgi:SulP family sulfate permease
MNPWLPKSIECLADYDKKKFLADLIAGVTVGFVALPLAMAFAISSGLSPQAGIYCAVVTGFLISALGGSKMQIGGPTGAFVVVVAGIVSKYGVEGLFVCTLMAGIILIVLGLTGMGTAVRYIPRPVVVGFTNGIAMLIASTQIKDFLGLKLDSVPSDFLLRMDALARAFHTLSYEATALGACSVALILFCSKFVKRVPGYIAALLLGTLVAALFQLPVETIGSKFGGIPSGLPHFQVPRMRWDLVLKLLSPALTIAMLGAIESLMSAVVSDRMSGDHHKPNVELIAQGVANIFSPMFGGLPATGAIARTATNIRAGAQTPVAGIIHAITLLAILIFAAPLAKFVPMPVLAGILFVVSWNMGEWKEIPELLKLSKADIAVWAVTFLLTVIADLTLAVEFGMILAALMFIRKVAVTTTISRVTHDYIAESRVHILQDKMIPDYVSIFRIHGPFLFGATEKIHEITARISELPETVILRLRNMPAIDATGMQALEEFAKSLKNNSRNLVLCGAREQPLKLMKQAGFEEVVGAENMCTSITGALDRAGELHRMATTSVP